MSQLFGKEFGERELLAYFGNTGAAAGIERFTYSYGKADGVKALRIGNGVLEAVLLESRALDMASLKYKGIPLNFAGKNGIVSAANADATTAPLRSVTGGMFYTAGLTNVGTAFPDGDYFHGRMRLIPAEKVSEKAEWENGKYRLSVSGEMNQNGVLCENLTLKRKVETELGSNTITVTDTVVNNGFDPSPLMLMYHIVAGFPLLDRDAKVFMTERTRLEENAYSCCAPNPTGEGSGGYLHESLADGEGNAYCALFNYRLKFGLLITYSANTLPYLSQWKSMKSGDYAMGLMPTNGHASGRQFEMDNGTLQTLEAGEKKDFSVSFTVIGSEDEMERLIAERGL